MRQSMRKRKKSRAKIGHRVNEKHFTGKKAGKKVRRKGTTRKQRKLKRGTHRNKYRQFAKSPRIKDASPEVNGFPYLANSILLYND